MRPFGLLGPSSDHNYYNLLLNIILLHKYIIYDLKKDLQVRKSSSFINKLPTGVLFNFY